MLRSKQLKSNQFAFRRSLSDINVSNKYLDLVMVQFLSFEGGMCIDIAFAMEDSLARATTSRHTSTEIIKEVIDDHKYTRAVQSALMKSGFHAALTKFEPNEDDLVCRSFDFSEGEQPGKIHLKRIYR
jgi:hypothetical protein